MTDTFAFALVGEEDRGWLVDAESTGEARRIVHGTVPRAHEVWESELVRNDSYYCERYLAGGPFVREHYDEFITTAAKQQWDHPDVLLRGEHAVSARREPASDELLQAQLAKLQRKIDAVASERRRLADLYQAGFIGHEELLRRGNELQNREEHLPTPLRVSVASNGRVPESGQSPERTHHPPGRCPRRSRPATHRPSPGRCR